MIESDTETFGVLITEMYLPSTRNQNQSRFLGQPEGKKNESKVDLKLKAEMSRKL